MYRILNPMNHNVSLVRNGNGEELVVIGKGIAFGKKKGDLISENQVEKVFRMKTEESRENFMTLLKDVPLDFITVTYEIIDNLSKKYQYPVQEYLYVTLTDHIYCSYQAISQGRYKDSNLPDISKEYPIAFQIAQESFEIYNSKLSGNLPKDEIKRIAYHFINAEGENEVEVAEAIDKRKEIIKKVESLLRNYDIQRTNENNNFYDRFMIHLNYFLIIWIEVGMITNPCSIWKNISKLHIQKHLKLVVKFMKLLHRKRVLTFIRVNEFTLFYIFNVYCHNITKNYIRRNLS